MGIHNAGAQQRAIQPDNAGENPVLNNGSEIDNANFKLNNIDPAEHTDGPRIDAFAQHDMKGIYKKKLLDNVICYSAVGMMSLAILGPVGIAAGFVGGAAIGACVTLRTAAYLANKPMAPNDMPIDPFYVDNDGYNYDPEPLLDT